MSPMEKNEHSGSCFWERLCFLRLPLRPLLYIIYYSDFLVAHTKAFAICYNCNYQPYLFQLWTVVDVSVKQDLIRQCVHFWTKRFLFGTRNHFGVLGPPPIDFLSYLSTEIATYISPRNLRGKIPPPNLYLSHFSQNGDEGDNLYIHYLLTIISVPGPL